MTLVSVGATAPVVTISASSFDRIVSVCPWPGEAVAVVIRISVAAPAGTSFGASTVTAPLTAESPTWSVCFYDGASGPAFNTLGTYDTDDYDGIEMSFGSSAPCHDVLSPPTNVHDPPHKAMGVSEFDI